MGTDLAKRRYLGLIGVVLALIIVMVLWPSGASRDAYDEGPEGGVDGPVDQSATRAGRTRSAESPTHTADAAIRETKSSAQQHIERFLDAQKYPPGSGRLTADHHDLLKWNTRHEEPQLVTDTHGRPEHEQVRFIFTADRYFYQSGQVVHAKLGAWKGDRPISLLIVDARAKREGRAGLAGQDFPLQFVEQDMTYLCDFVPAVAFPEHHGNILLDVILEYGEGELHEAQLRLFYTPDSAIPARFTGSFRDAVEEGSLVVRAGVEVFTRGFFIINANLFDGLSRPVAFTTFKGELSPGDTEVPLVFFGRILHDADGSPPYVVTDLRGYRFLDGQFPDREPMSQYQGTHTTGHYQLDAFWEDDWTSDQKEWMLDQLLRAAEAGAEFPVAATPGTEPTGGEP